ncbi:hypothetical protein PCANC_05120 [Puccinia coronata f. sp. avenae]|uniref:Uncharacterized protein n=1 Tax=Puccinia coronata f. sp. avenae TaxID=200324 RepID=A0A2N5W384_9BASI|nr:hypothetical protein PCANC_05120 [Puccinia coronata f. sp. avenae]
MKIISLGCYSICTWPSRTLSVTRFKLQVAHSVLSSQPPISPSSPTPPTIGYPSAPRFALNLPQLHHPHLVLGVSILSTYNLQVFLDLLRELSVLKHTTKPRHPSSNYVFSCGRPEVPISPLARPFSQPPLPEEQGSRSTIAPHIT